MESFHEYMNEYKKQLEKGIIQKAYKGLMEYIMALRTHLKNKTLLAITCEHRPEGLLRAV